MAAGDANYLGKAFFERDYSGGGAPYHDLEPVPWVKRFSDKFAEEFGAEGKAVLDLGCCVGRNSMPFAEKGFRVYGIDYVAAAVERAKDNARSRGLGSRTDFRTGNIMALPYDDHFFDVVLDINTSHHIPEIDYERHMDELCRVIRKGGYFLLSAFRKESEKEHGILSDVNGNELYCRYFSEKSIRSVFGKQFRIIVTGNYDRSLGRKFVGAVMAKK